MSLHASAMQNSVLTSFIGALQGSVSVLLTIGYGMIAGQFKLIKDSSAKDISRLCVKLLQPALLIINVGSEVHPETLPRYFPIIGEYLSRIGLGKRLTRPPPSLVCRVQPGLNSDRRRGAPMVQDAQLRCPSLRV